MEKISIIGGGPAGISAALALTQESDWHMKREVTIYQLGWRLGGKCASGRNDQYGQRIEEHGVHILFGFYQNSFTAIRQIYKEIGDNQPGYFSNWQAAFEQHNLIAMFEEYAGETSVWEIDFPPKPGLPGDGNSEAITAHNIFQTILAFIRNGLLSIQHEADDIHQIHSQQNTSYIKSFFQEIGDDTEDIADISLHYLTDKLLKAIEYCIDQEDDEDSVISSNAHSLLSRIWKLLEHEIFKMVEHTPAIRRLYIMLDFGFTSLRGMFADHVFEQGWDVINDKELRTWLTLHGGSQLMIDSSLIRAFYDLVFGYKNGDIDTPDVEAGTMLRAMFRIVISYQGSLMWKMRAGTGDVIFAPAYAVLKARGVKFEFFCQATQLEGKQIDGDNVIDRITLTRQANLNSAEYNPLIEVKGLYCWPSAPLLEQIDTEQASLIQQFNINLESNWNQWNEIYNQQTGKELPTITLERGIDFDNVILATSLEPLHTLLDSDTLAYSPPLVTMLSQLKTTATQAYQLWFQPDLAELGYHEDPEHTPIMTSFYEPMDTWAVMNQVTLYEDWKQRKDPDSISYFCGPLKVDSYSSEPDFPHQQKQRVKELAIRQMNTQLKAIWPNADIDEHFMWDWLYRPEDSILSGEALFDTQYWRANVDQAERYVLSLTGTTIYRLESDASGFTNLFLAGDWTKSGLNIGCFEASTMSGLQASRAICGFPQNIYGENDFS